MPAVFAVWIAVVSLVGLIWLTRHLELSRARRSQRTLSTRSYGGPPAPAPRISVLVAAKDEEANIADCVRSLLDQDYPNYELIVINDRSTDRTAAILAELASSSSRATADPTLQDLDPRPNGVLKVVTVKSVRDGWFGKNNAMREGVAAATGDWLCFADADCRQTSRSSLSIAIREAVDRRIDFLSVLPVLETRTFWERLLQPVCAAIMIIWFHPRRVNDPRSRAAYANGAFMLMTRDCYERIGGHAAVRTQVNEDMHMARLAKERGLTLNVIQNEDLYVTRMYSSFAETWRGWSRIFYGCFGTLRRLSATAGLILVSSIFPWVSFLVAALASFTTHGDSRPWRAVALAALIVIALQQSVTFRFYRLARSDPAWSFGYFVGAVLCLGMLFNAMLKLGGATRTVWRGTTYRGDAREEPESTAPRPEPVKATEASPDVR